MKKLVALLVLMTLGVGAFAMSYRTARQQALFLTDKMAYELNLTDDQYNAAYEINLDYLMNIGYERDILGIYWDRRNAELQYVLSALQYRVFLETEYFYRPVVWTRNAFSFLVYNRYAKNRFFRPAPRVYETYRGSNNMRYQHSPYHGRVFGNEPNRPVNANPGARVPSMSRRESIKEGNRRDNMQAPQGNMQNRPNGPSGPGGAPKGNTAGRQRNDSRRR